jgi:hypothetical protein
MFLEERLERLEATITALRAELALLMPCPVCGKSVIRPKTKQLHVNRFWHSEAECCEVRAP